MSAKHHETHKHDTKPKSATKTGKSEAQQHRMLEKDEAVRHADETAQKDKRTDRTAGQNRAIDQKRNDEQQYHAGGVAHDPHNRTQERVNSSKPEAGDVEQETRSGNAPYNKTYSHHE